MTILSIPLGRFWGGTEEVVVFSGFLSAPDFSLALALDFKNSLSLVFIPAFLSIVFVDFFDSISTFIGVSQVGGMVDKKGNPHKLKESLLVDAFGSTISGVVGITSVTTYVESAVGVLQGGRTGITAIIAGLCFLPFLFFNPLISAVPVVASAPVLILAGCFMIKPIFEIEWAKLDEALPSFLSIVIIAFTCSITNGIIIGFISYALCKLFSGKARVVSFTFYVICIICILIFILDQHRK